MEKTKEEKEKVIRECAVCHRTENEVQIRRCSLVDLYLCSKHKNQLYRHGTFMSDERPVRVCDICGTTSADHTVIWCTKADKYLCSKHIAQFNRLGHFLPETMRDPNDFILHDEYAEIIFKNWKTLERIGSALIDLEDVERCRQHKWTMSEFRGNSRYVSAIINDRKVSLHRFILNYTGDLVVDHINRNGLDNRKSNLRIVTIQENCINSRTHSRTGEKNIYQKESGHYQVQIIRNYKKIYIKTFDTLEDAVIARDEFLRTYKGAA